ncbi:XRE family transcriptional regulator [Lichenibacterium minor]|uniref:XRE family transcriptional regulator n=1 Tax=Lichenibacterium minor TaxID=2316528 RepID=A0A4Q2TXW4_9HYPH|nr:helix-turn-helix transcriptional regulator [Lichenibacterium minor]RYC28939.1 XRE family transcriptional regulator [Lichenibacterium minor]
MRSLEGFVSTPEQETPPEPLAAPPEQPAKGRNRNPEFETAFGARLRAARVAAKMSQTELGAAVGISFQQVQKYEQGKDRVSASTLQCLATALGVHPASFFGDETSVPSGDVKPVRAAMAVAADWQRIKNPETRKGLAKLIATLAAEGQIEPES